MDYREYDDEAPFLHRFAEGLCIIIAAIFVPPLVIVITRIFSTGDVERNIAPGLVVGCGMVLFWWRGTHTPYPEIRTSNIGVSIRVVWKWHLIEWNSITTCQYYGALVLKSKQLPIGYSAIGRSMGLREKAICIRRTIRGYDSIEYLLRMHDIRIKKVCEKR